MTKLTILAEKFDNHVREYTAEVERIHDTMKMIITTIDNIRENHLAHLRDKINSLDARITRIDTNLKWTMRIGGVILIETLGVLIKILTT